MADSGKLAILQNLYLASLRDLSGIIYSLILNLNSSPVGVESLDIGVSAVSSSFLLLHLARQGILSPLSDSGRGNEIVILISLPCHRLRGAQTFEGSCGSAAGSTEGI